MLVKAETATLGFLQDFLKAQMCSISDGKICTQEHKILIYDQNFARSSSGLERVKVSGTESGIFIKTSLTH